MRGLRRRPEFSPLRFESYVKVFVSSARRSHPEPVVWNIAQRTLARHVTLIQHTVWRRVWSLSMPTLGAGLGSPQRKAEPMHRLCSPGYSAAACVHSSSSCVRSASKIIQRGEKRTPPVCSVHSRFLPSSHEVLPRQRLRTCGRRRDDERQVSGRRCAPGG